MHTITPEDMMRYLNGNASKKKTAEIKEALKNDWKLRLSIETLASIPGPTDMRQAMLSDRVVNELLKYGAKEKE